MTTAYTPILKLALPVTGELNGTWGDVVNQNITSMVEQAIAGLATINSWTANSHTLTTADGTTSESRCAMLVADDDGAGNPSAAATIICPNASKLYIVKNISGQTVTLKTAAGTGIAVPNNQTSFLFCDGTNVESCVTSIVDGNVAGNLTVQGNATVNGNTTLGNATTDTVTLTARVASVVSPSADNTYDLGSVANSWKDLYIDGTAYLATISGTTGNITTVNSTTVDTTNLEVTNLKAKDGTAAGSIANATGVVTLASSVLTTTDINGGTIDATTIGATTPSTVVATQVDIVAQGDLRLQDTTGGQFVALHAPTAIASSYTLTLPVDDGTAGQALITDGSGVLSWSSAASGDVYGPASATDNAVARYDGTTGKIIQNSAVTIADDGATVIAANSTSDGLRITQTGTGNALLVEDSANPDSTPFAVNADGKVVVGNTSALNLLGSIPQIQQHGTSTSTAMSSNSAWGAVLAQQVYSRSAGTSVGDYTSLSVNNDIGLIRFAGADGTALIDAARISASVDGTPGTNDMPGRLVFSTTADGASSPTERMRIGSAGDVGIGTASIGTSSRLRISSNPNDLAVTYNISYADGTHTLSADSTVSFAAVGSLANLNQNGFNATISLNSGGNLKGFSSRAYVTGATGTVTSAVGNYADVRNTGAGTLTNAVGFQAAFTNSGGGTLTNAYGVYIPATTAATNNYAFHANNAAGTGRWNFYAAGTADNYFAGNVGIGSTALTTTNFRVSANITGGTTAYASFYSGVIQPTVTASAIYQQTQSNTAANGAVPYTINTLRHYSATQGTFNADSTVTNQYGFIAESGLTGATNNYGFYGNIALGTGRWNLYMAGTAGNYMAGGLQIANTGQTALQVTGGANIGTSTSTTALRSYSAANWNFANTDLIRNASNTATPRFLAFALDADDLASTTIGGYNAIWGIYNAAPTTGSTSVALQGEMAYASFYGHRWYINGTERARIASTGVISLGAAPGAESLRVTPVASAVNYINAFGGATGNVVSFAANGSDTNIGIAYTSKGNGIHDFFSNNYGSLQFRVAHTASAVNYLQVTGAATGGFPTYSAQGSDANIGLSFATKGTASATFYSNSNVPTFAIAGTSASNDYLALQVGTGNTDLYSTGSSAAVNMRYVTRGSGGHQFFTGTYGSGVQQFNVAHTASAVNYLQVTGATTGSGATLSAQGSDANIDLNITAKGVNSTVFRSGGGAQFAVANTASAVNFLRVTGSATGGSVSMSALGSDTNIDLALTPKGTGVVRDANGNIRAVPQSGTAKTTSYSLATTDVGEFIEVGTGGSITIPDATFATGDVVSIFNNTTGNVTITCTITTAYIGGTDADKATVTLATRGVATILFISGTVCVINGNVT